MNMEINKIVAAAYDFKASLDLAGAFVRSGLSVDIWNGFRYFKDSRAMVSVYNLESYSLHPEAEYSLVARLFGSTEKSTLCFWKTDSSLRGNLGAELIGMMDGRGEDRLLLLTAHPIVRKFTKDAVQYHTIDNQPIVLANAAERIRTFRHIPILWGEGVAFDKEGIYVPNCDSQEAFDCLVDDLKKDPPMLLAGTSALAERLAYIYQLPRLVQIKVDGKSGKLELASLTWEEDN